LAGTYFTKRDNMSSPDAWILNNTIEKFSQALAAKLQAAEEKYGWKGAWLEESRVPSMRTDLAIHIQKGDPLDVAAFAMFLWYHGASTNEDQ
jgi:hypothetical protein